MHTMDWQTYLPSMVALRCAPSSGEHEVMPVGISSWCVDTRSTTEGADAWEHQLLHSMG